MVRTSDGLAPYPIEISRKANHSVPLANPDPKIFPCVNHVLYHADAMQKLDPAPMGDAARRTLITDTSVARLALAKDEAGYVVRDRDVRGFIVKVGMRRKTFRYEGEQRSGKHRKVISRKYESGRRSRRCTCHCWPTRSWGVPHRSQRGHHRVASVGAV